MSVTIYIDESGDLGWEFNYPYNQGGSSRFLTIAALIVPTDSDHIPGRAIRQLYDGFGWDTKREKKWSEMCTKSRLSFATSAAKLHQNKPQIEYCTIIVNKQNVDENFRRDSNKLYNYMLRLLLLQKMTAYTDVLLMPDQRSLKVETGNSLQAYLEQLLYDSNARTKLNIKPCDSKKVKNIQFVDMLAGAIGNKFEVQKNEPYELIKNSIDPLKKLFF